MLNSILFLYDRIDVRIVNVSYEPLETDQTTNSSSKFVINYKSEIYNSWIISREIYFSDDRPNKFRYYFSQFPSDYQYTQNSVVIFIISSEIFKPGITEFSGIIYIDIINYNSSGLPEGSYILSSDFHPGSFDIYKTEFNIVSGNIEFINLSIPNWGKIKNPNLALVVFELFFGLVSARIVYYKFLKKVIFEKKEVKKIDYWKEL